MQAIKYVRQLPPNERFKIDVSLESLYGMYCSLPLTVVSYKARITLRKKNKDLFIYIASLLNRPTGLNTLYDPARSTK